MPGVDTPISNRPKPTNAGCLVLFFGIFLIAGLGAFTAFFVRPAIHVLRAQSWEPVPARVISSRLTTNRGKSTTYHVEVTYSYTYNGQSFHSSRYEFTTMATSNYSAHR